MKQEKVRRCQAQTICSKMSQWNYSHSKAYVCRAVCGRELSFNRTITRESLPLRPFWIARRSRSRVAQYVVVTWLNNQAPTWYEENIHKLVPRYDKCLNVKGDYVEKQTKVCAKTCIFSFRIIVKEYLGMAKHSLPSGWPTYFPLLVFKVILRHLST